MSYMIKNILAAIADLIFFLILWLYLGIPWYLAFFISTLIVIGLWWLLAWIYGWASYWLRY